MGRSDRGEMIELRWRRMGFVLFAVAGIATLTVGYSLQRRAHDVLGMQIKAMEKQADWAKASTLSSRETLARIKRPSSIFRQVVEMKLDLTNIAPSQRRVILLQPQARVAGPESAAPSPAPVPSPVQAPVRPLTGTALPVRSSP